MIGLKYIIKFITYLLYTGILRKLLEKQENLRNKSRVLIQINSGIGDSICALPLIHELNVNGYEVHVIVNENTIKVAKLCPDIKKSYIVDYKIKNIIKTFKIIHILSKQKYRYFCGALPSNRIRDNFLPIILKIPFRVKHFSPHKEKYRNHDFLFNRLMKLNDNQNCAISNFMLLSLIDEHLGSHKKVFKIFLPKSLIRSVKKKLRLLGLHENKIIIGIHPGCNENRAFKRWPKEYFAELVDLLKGRGNLQVIIFGGFDEKNLAEYFVRKQGSNVFNLIGKLSLEETACAISLCKIFISNDSGLMHIATVFKIPVIGLFGGRSNELRSGPYGSHHVIMKKNNLRKITVSEVFKKTLGLLDKIICDDDQKNDINSIHTERI